MTLTQFLTKIAQNDKFDIRTRAQALKLLALVKLEKVKKYAELN